QEGKARQPVEVTAGALSLQHFDATVTQTCVRWCTTGSREGVLGQDLVCNRTQRINRRETVDESIDRTQPCRFQSAAERAWQNGGSDHRVAVQGEPQSEATR